MLVQSCVDMVLFENVVLFVAMPIIGAVLGLQTAEPTPSKSNRRLLIGSILLIVGLSCLTVLVTIPVTLADRLARRADQAAFERRLPEAIELYTRAFETLPVGNVEYALRLSGMSAQSSARLDDALGWADRAVQSDPASINARLTRARLRVALHPRDPTSSAMRMALEDYSSAIDMNPNEIATRIEFADVLELAGRPAQAREQLQAALRVNDGYDAGEPERLSPDQARRLVDRIRSLEL
jgi:tetratricopeptide (TPR) repeat protein